MDFESLVGHINQVQDVLQAQAAHAVNLSLTARNWLVGYYIVEFEQHGEDRAKYGENLLNRLAQSINKKGFSPRRLREYRQFYLVYPVLGVEVEKYIDNTSTQLLKSGVSSNWRLSTAKLEGWATPPERLFYRINYTSLSILSSIDNPLKRAFYEQESIRGCWTNTELDRQISLQYYERMGLSKDKKALQKLAVKNAQQLAPRDILHNPVTLEFLGLESQDVYTETKLESYILNHLQAFLLEMGRGFCFSFYIVAIPSCIVARA